MGNFFFTNFRFLTILQILPNFVKILHFLKIKKKLFKFSIFLIIFQFSKRRASYHLKNRMVADFYIPML